MNSPQPSEPIVNMLLPYLEKAYSTAIQDERGVTSNRKGFMLRYDIVPQQLALEAHAAIERMMVEKCLEEIDKADKVLQPPHIENSGNDYTRMSAWFKDRRAILLPPLTQNSENGGEK